ncbi:unnamed protein product [Rotaria sordida]|uniref:PPM-type phosphatase domain-containing protein n=1 Tax=Rotaria sordida TaxID=392033 RepID=A0A814YPD9_9BILA|nr:unnamed protein product [Rotaria sordida]CAF1231897.1 unnamed protein product [Rotaria sordida]
MSTYGQELIIILKASYPEETVFKTFEFFYGKRAYIKRLSTHDDTQPVTTNETIPGVPIDHEQLTRFLVKYFLHSLEPEILRNTIKTDKQKILSAKITNLIDPEQIYLINIDDSRTIIFSNGELILAYTEDHKLNDSAEQERIHEAVGKISETCADDVLRVENQLAMTHVLGDFEMDKHIIPPTADIVKYPRNSLGAFVFFYI